MKPHFEKDILGKKSSRLVKIEASTEAYFTNFDFKTIVSFPRSYTLKSFNIMPYLLLVFLAVTISLSIIKLIGLFRENLNGPYSISTILSVIVAQIVIMYLIVMHSLNKKSSPILILTYDNLTYNETKISWSEITGIYGLWETFESSSILTKTIIKKINKDTLEIQNSFPQLDNHKVPHLISAYKTRWDKQTKK